MVESRDIIEKRLEKNRPSKQKEDEEYSLEKEKDEIKNNLCIFLKKRCFLH